MKATLLLTLLWGAASARAAFTMADIRLWAGVPDGPGVNSAALVVDWNDGQPPLAWGFRWIGPAPSGRDMLRAVLASDRRFTLQGLETGFVSHFAFDANLDGTPERFRPGWDGVANFWGYSVNNAVFTHPTDFTQNGHVVPPNVAVIPNGPPFAAANSGAWVVSSTGVAQRPLANGSWDGFVYGDGSRPPVEPVAAAPIPEPTSLPLILSALAPLGWRRQRAPRR